MMGISNNVNKEYLKFVNHFNGKEDKELKDEERFLKTTRFEKK